MRAFLVLVFLMGSATMTVNKSTYFPKNVFGTPRLDTFSAGIYSYHLKLFREPSLLLESKDHAAQSYRFLWLRTFHHAVVIRVDVSKDGTGTVVTKMSSGASGFGIPNRNVIEDVSRPVSLADVQSLLKVLDEKHFFAIPSYVSGDQTGNDGSDWVLEGVKDGKYHVISRWTPCNHPGPGKKAVCSIGRTFVFDLGHMDVPVDEVY